MTREQQIDYAALILRVALGVMFMAHGLLKVMVFTLPGTVQFFDSVGFAGWMAYPVTILEIAGGSLLILGITTRWTAIAMIPVLLGALSVHLGNGWVFNNPNGGWEYAAFLTMACVVQALLGDGAHTARQFLPGNQHIVRA